ncbi:Uu.00g077900.m01.CDS01 [Anthostomella pinea]|uniref:Uu.00g077900.m01.CDS01 n=1 Tax=Anthostomella pinea TaxID=933095 RepID=A0AAI8VKI1_9PEZI|nr:Uu.00g077900.m01.CDS01 [Anthostomella pinea]
MSTSSPVTQVDEGARPVPPESCAYPTTSPGPNSPPLVPEPPPLLPASDNGQGQGGSIIQAPAGPGKRGAAKNQRKDGGERDAKDARDPRDPKAGARTGSPVTPSSAIDPLSQHIFVRTNTDRTIPSRLRNPARPGSPANEGLPRPSSDLSVKHPTPQLEPARDKKKGGSFLSRLSMIGGKKKDDDNLDDDSEINGERTEGADAVAFGSAAIGASGYIPHHKEPPRYIRVRARNKKVREFNRIFLAQELAGTRPPSQDGQAKPLHGGTPTQSLNKKEHVSGGPIWAIEFSRDGRYLATGGRDRVVRVWAVIATQEDRDAYEEEANAAAGNEERLSAPVFRAKPVREFTGHSGDILDLSWSKNNFLLSSSMDKTVRLWHMSRQECLCTFKHKDFVTSIAFHPRDDRFFLAGSLDSTLRLWSIPDKAVAYSSQLSDLITAVAFSPDGKTAIAGCLNGFCMFYDTEGLKYNTQIHVRSSRGKNAKGSKITGIQTMSFPSGGSGAPGVIKVIITSNDSRIRIYNLGDKNLEGKLKGHENACNQIRASFSDDGNYIICGSEDRRAFIWSMGTGDSDVREKPPYEYFEAHSDVVTEAVFAPTATRQLLQSSDDPIFSLCNPPPVTLLSKEETVANPTLASFDVRSEHSAKARKPDESPAFIARSTHYDGNIIVTADHAGLIKVFRQDCAFAKRRHENWETGSTFSRRLGRDGLLGRTGSIMTRTSAGSREPRSRRGSLTQPVQINSDRINTWRHGVEGNPARPSSMVLSTPARSERSVSPSKATRTPATSSVATPASEARRQAYATTSPLIHSTSPTSSVQTSRTNEKLGFRGDTSIPPTPSFSIRSFDDDADVLRLDPAGASYSFWNLNKWRNISQLRGNNSQDPSSLVGSASGHNRSASASLLPDMEMTKKSRRKSTGAGAVLEDEPVDGHAEKADRRKSVPAGAMLVPGEDDKNHLSPPERIISNQSGSLLSRLSSELTSEEGEETRCSKCGSGDFRAKKVGGKQRLLCGKCGRLVDV